MHREKFKPLGGPDGGNGGRGGDVVLYVDPQTTTLLDYHHSPHRKATNGQPGGRATTATAPTAATSCCRCPTGTVVKDADGEVIADLVGAGDDLRRRRAAAAAASATRRWPPRGARPPASPCSASPATPSTWSSSSRRVADVALVGYPSAGKSSLVAALSAARPEDRRLPVHHAGAEPRRRHGRRRSASPSPTCPGLIPGASEGKGLGLEFLRHVERCSVLVHVIDCATLEPDRDPLSDLDVIEAELAAVRAGRTLGGRPLSDRPA